MEEDDVLDNPFEVEDTEVTDDAVIVLDDGETALDEGETALDDAGEIEEVELEVDWARAGLATKARRRTKISTSMIADEEESNT